MQTHASSQAAQHAIGWTLDQQHHEAKRLGARILETHPHGSERWTGGTFGFGAGWPGGLTLFLWGYFGWRMRPRA